MTGRIVLLEKDCVVHKLTIVSKVVWLARCGAGGLRNDNERILRLATLKVVTCMGCLVKEGPFSTIGEL
jgi:hypothetical protein